MRRSTSDPRALAYAAIALGWLACGPPPEPPIAVPAPKIAAHAPPSEHPPGRRPGSILLAAPQETSLDFVLQPIPGGRSVLAVSQHADERAAWVRRLGDGGAGPLLRFVDSHVFGAFDRSDGSTTYVTSDGTNVCFGPTARPQERTCVQSNPAAIVPVGDRLALLEISAAHVPQPRSAHPPRPSPKPRQGKPPAHKGKRPAKGAGKKKRSHGGARAQKPSRPLVELFVRWVEPGGAVDAEPTSTGLHFEAPLDGMTLADARARPPGIDVLWFETAPGRKTRSPLGSGRLMAASLWPDGALDFASRVPVVDADSEYGQLKDHHAPRLVGSDAASVYVGLDEKGQCEALRVLPALARLTVPPAECAVAPDLLAAPIDPAEVATLERIAANHPRRAASQPRGDPGLVAWAGERGYYVQGKLLRSAAREGGAQRDEPPPFPARRASIAWGALAPDSEWVAFAQVLIHGRASGAPDYVPVPPAMATWIAGAPELPPDRRRAARIGATWWTARGPRMRLWPEASAPTSLPGDPDTSVLVGGSEHGLSLAISGGVLQVGAVDATGAGQALSALAPSPVGPGFDACERAAGGALVAGAGPGKPGGLVAFTLDGAGRAGSPHPLPADLAGGHLGVRLVPLPSGGALVTDRDRRHVAWIDDEARLLAAAPWPAGESDAACPYGRPMPLSVPGPTPGTFIPVPGVAEGACVVGDPTWTRSGALRWFGGTSESLDFTPELASLPLLPAFPGPAPAAAPAAPGPAPLPSPRVCPPDMVSIAGRFCVDRFEAMIIDARDGAPLSPDYPTTPKLLDFVLGEWSTGRERAGNVHARAFPLPWISPSRLGDDPRPLAVSRLGVRPSGYLTGVVAEAACAAAGKRLCSLDEFVTACRGQDDTPFPYGDTYEDGACNVFRDEHPAALLHGNASIGHLDPRLDRVLSHGRPLLRLTGDTLTCRSRWGDDAIFDMVGNLDEWVAEGNGAFAGGFYSRSTRSGCEAVVTAHPRAYLDYSTGVRCCRDRS